LLPWKGSGLSVCGNDGCDKGTINAILTNAPMKKSDGYYNDEFPSIRACPKCETIIEHSIACKHMTCSSCKTDFCFRCLGIKPQGGQWPCGSYSFACEVKPKQVLQNQTFIS